MIFSGCATGRFGFSRAGISSITSGFFGGFEVLHDHAHDLVFAALEVAVVAEVRELGGRGDCDAVVVCAESVEVAVFEVEGWWQVF